MSRNTEPGLKGQVEAFRRFNRLYTRRIGALGECYLQSPFSLTEARVLYELRHRGKPAATELGRELGLDAGYLSRILRGFGKRGLVSATPSPSDRRRSLLSLTARGRRAFAPLEARARKQVGAMLRALPAGARIRLLQATSSLEQVLRPAPARPGSASPFVLRPPRPGDLGFVIHRHGTLYAEEHRYDAEFEALVAGIVAGFARRHDPKRERCWIAERDGIVVGSIFLMRKSKTVARLRLLFVEPSTRGLGLGARLVSECVRFARRAGYRKITLWTQSDLHAARHLYEKAGFRVVDRHAHHSFGRRGLVAETWDLAL
jgi:DNA-binding MarR family transcriptional regulator/GNAT superfamily N-acetyltransferase